MTDNAEEKPVDVGRRRHFLRSVATATGALPFTQGLAAGVVAASWPALAADPAAAPAAAPVVAYVCFSQDEAAFVETMVNIMCPADDLTPNGVDCGLPTYIDRQLAGDFGRGLKRYARGPWLPGKPQHGYQLPLTPEQWFKAGVEAANVACFAQYGKAFDQITPAQGDQFLTDLSTNKVASERVSLAGWFNDLVYPLFQEACFSDPAYGGNGNKVFWRMIGYPGLPATNTINMVQYRGKPYPGSSDPKSIADFS